jgi:hypothetical protein
MQRKFQIDFCNSYSNYCYLNDLEELTVFKPDSSDIIY